MVLGDTETLPQASNLPSVATAGDILYYDGTNWVVYPDTAAQGDILYYNGTAWKSLVAGTSGDFLKTQGASANPIWAAIIQKEVKVAVTTWTTTFTTSSNTFIDITDATVTLSGLDSGKTYSLISVASVDSTNTDYVRVQLLIDGTKKNKFLYGTVAASSYLMAGLSGVKTGVTGSTSYIAKLQTGGSASTRTYNNGETASIMLIAVEE